MRSRLPEGWKEVELAEVSNVIDSLHKTPKYSKTGYPMIRVSDLLDGYFDIPKKGVRYVNEDTYLEFSKSHKPMYGDILFSRVGTYGLTSFVKTKKEFCLGQNTVVITNLKKGMNNLFIYYSLHSRGIYNQIEQNVTGSTQKTISMKSIRGLRLRIPPLKEQKAIADILSALDDKIELNNKINENLEQQAQAIFKHWFIDFEFPDENGNPYKSSGGEMIDSELGMIPKGWEVGEIKDYADVKSGYAFKSSWWQDDGVKVLKITNISSGELTLGNCSYVNEDKVPIEERYIAYPSDVLIALTGATLGQMSIIPKLDETLLVNQRVGKFVYNEGLEYPLPFLYCLLSTDNIMGEIIDRGQGSAQPNISPTSLGSIKFTYPSTNLINSFNIKCKPFFEHYIYSYNQNIKLSQLRDTLLPKLMNGEIRIPLD